MDILLQKALEEDTNNFNKTVCEGLAVKEIESLPYYLNRVIEEAVKTLPSGLDFKYLGWRKMTPVEDFKNNINAAATKDVVDISHNYLYKVIFMYEYEGELIERPQAFIYVDKGGYFELSDNSMVITPVLSEYPVSGAPGEVFIRLLRDKINIKKKTVVILKDGEPFQVPLIFGKMYKLVEGVNDTIPIALYAFIKYGFYGVFEKLHNTKPILVSNIHKEKKGYTAYTTTGKKPRTLSVVNYQPHDITIYIKTEDITPTLEIYIASLILSFDYTPLYSQAGIKVIKKLNEPNTDFLENISDEALFWITLLGKVVFKNKFMLDRIQPDMLEHIGILNGYLDSIIKTKLTEIGIYAEDFYDLLIWIIPNFNALVNSVGVSDVNMLDSRYVDLPYYALFDLIVGINKAFLEIKRATINKTLTYRILIRIFNKHIRVKQIFGLVKRSKVNISIASVSYTGDNLVLGYSTHMEDQNRANGVTRSVSNNSSPTSNKFVKAMDMIAGEPLVISKGNLSPLGHINPFVKIDPTTNRFDLTDEQKRIVAKINSKLGNTFIDDSLSESINSDTIIDIDD